MALCEKVFAPHPLLKHNCGLSHLSSVSLATSRPDYCHTCSQSRNHLNRTCLTKWSRPKDPQKLHIMLRSKEIQEQMRKKVIEIYQSGKVIKPFLNLWDSSEPQWEPLSTNGETWNSGEPSQEWPADQNYPKSAATTHPRGHKRPHNNI